MTDPDPDEVESEFQVLEEDYAEEDFHGGVFEGSHAYGDAVVLRLYSVVPGEDGPKLRVETRHHAGGRVLEHAQSEYPLTEEFTVEGDGRPLEKFCRDHHYDDPVEEVGEVLESLDCDGGP